MHALDINVIGEGFSTRPGKPAEIVDLKSTCTGDALLAGSARFTMCFAPWRSDTDACLERADLDMRIDLSSCVAVRDALAVSEISMLEPKQAEKVTPIDPEPLIEAMKQPEKQPPPPELKELLAQQQQKAPTPPPPPQPKRPMQVVETVKPSAEKEPENARFLAEYNSSTDKQKVSRGAVKEPMVAKAKPEELTPKENPKEVEQAKQEPDRAKGMNKQAPDVPGTLSMRDPGAQKPAEVQQDAKSVGTANGETGPLAFDGFMPRRGTGAFEQERKERSEIPKGQNGAGGGAPDLDLKPSQDVLERALGGGSVDHLDDVANEDETALNAKRWVHATFFNRLKRQVAQNWDPASVWRRQDPSGQVYGFKTRVTEVRVTLSLTGQLTKIVVTSPSGVSELDDEAVRAFQQAAPFVNPPKELANAEGNIVFGFSFYFEIGAPRSSWRVVRSN
ncbi:MAG: TonB family protein [Kofleriaceae bacterium]|nr:TonB family protein [Kofleriaceae bacterium]